MKLQFLSIAGLLASALAAPTSESSLDLDVAEASPVSEVRDISPEALGLVKRAVRCKIVNSSSSTVNCRSGPRFEFSVVGSVKVGYSYPFNCYQSGDCYEGNCTWQQVPLEGGHYCYVNGYYTDSKCTAAALGKC
ncbi:hypothetical protein BJY04DRAFT_31575 [Aspergillus karnatakaensis]|uniref:uncharacterized protein n=1 Tax=Aspergillus karnatakaensis TaxID=1810916 RepID=UPI003CCD583A